jgi:PAS domain S-box-containing protein
VRVLAAVESALDPVDPKPYSTEYRVVRPNGAVRWVEAHGLAAFEGEGPARRATRLVGTVADVTERKTGEAELQESTALLQAISDTSHDVIFAKDRAGRMRFANPATLALIGKPLEDVLGRTDLELLDDEAAARQVMENDRRIMESGVGEELEERVPMPDRVERVWLSRKSPYRDAAGNVVGLLGISRDITERKRTEEALRDADRRKGEFLAVLSHELRNPLAPIRNGIHLLERAAPGSAQAARAREIVRRQAEHLTRLVDDLLDITRISRGKIELRRARVDLREVADRTTDDLHALFEQSRVALRVERSAGPVWVDADPTRIAQVLGNLLHNAVNFTPAGGTVTVTISARDGRAELAVRDDGVGMDPVQVEAMFEPFAQADQNLARTKGGLGLGLALVKGLVELHGGTVQARSGGIDRGAEFAVTLPLSSTRAAAAGGADPATAHGRVVLVIEDNADAGQSLADLLELEGHRVHLAEDGRSGIDLAREVRPDVILCDIGLPDLNGYEVARALRRDDALRSVRLVAVSGYARPEDRRRAADAGFDAHVAKPPVAEDLLSAILATDG